eukprot:jgi/Mesvir1/27019/Mv20725-RA.1
MEGVIHSCQPSSACSAVKAPALAAGKLSRPGKGTFATPIPHKCASYLPGRFVQRRLNSRRGSAVTECKLVELKPFGEKSTYKDSPLDTFLINVLSKRIAEEAGDPRDHQGFDGFLVATENLFLGKSQAQQHEAVGRVLRKAFPDGPRRLFRKLLDRLPRLWLMDFAASVTTVVFEFLVGPCEVVPVEVNGQMRMSGVKIGKCRYLEASGCTGMCVNMCKVPTQNFLTDELGLPVTLKPDFKDMSCEMIFGSPPPPLAEDEAMRQPCLSLSCDASNPSALICPRTNPVKVDNRPVQ